MRSQIVKKLHDILAQHHKDYDAGNYALDTTIFDHRGNIIGYEETKISLDKMSKSIDKDFGIVKHILDIKIQDVVFKQREEFININYPTIGRMIMLFQIRKL